MENGTSEQTEGEHMNNSEEHGLLPGESGMTMSAQIDEIATAMNAALTDIEDVNKTTQGYGYKYAPLDEVLPVIRAACAQHGLYMLQSPWSPSASQLGVTTLLTHTSGQWISTRFAMPVEQLKGMNLYQSSGAALSYIRRYQALSLWAMAQGEDNDAAHKKPDKAAVKKDEPLPETPKAVLNSLTKAAARGPESLTKAYEKLSDEQKAAIIPADKINLKAIARGVH